MKTQQLTKIYKSSVELKGML